MSLGVHGYLLVHSEIAETSTEVCPPGSARIELTEGEFLGLSCRRLIMEQLSLRTALFMANNSRQRKSKT